MYGLLLGAFADGIIAKYGQDVWLKIKEKAGVTYSSFATHTIYSETLLPRLVNASSVILQESVDEIQLFNGANFVEYSIKFGYDNFMRLLGRTLSDFFNGLDNLHAYFHQSYPEMKRVSFVVSEESRNGLTLHYRSKRKGYKNYVQGQIIAVAKLLFDKEVKIEIKDERLVDGTTFVEFDVFFDNAEYTKRTRPSSKVTKLAMKVRSQLLFELFPFNIVFNSNMMITNVGNSLLEIMPDILEQPVDDIFKLVKPMASLTWETLKDYENNSFELETVDCLTSNMAESVSGTGSLDGNGKEKTALGKLLLRGQMLFVEDWDQIMFVCTPVLRNVKQMLSCGLYINDLSLHDTTRAAVLAGSQQSNQTAAELRKVKSHASTLQESLKKLESEMTRTSKFLQEMMPKSISDRMRNGEHVLSLTEQHPTVTILFASIVNFPSYVNESKPMNVIKLLNLAFSVYDQLVKSHNAYKVETVGDTYMVACGAPEPFENHAEEAADLALHMLHVANFIIPPDHESPIEVKIGFHTGRASTGVIGMRCPRFCFFGDTVNTASRMCSNSTANRAQFSETTKLLLDKTENYIFESRGHIPIKGKGDMRVYYLLGTHKKMKYLEQLKVIVIQSMNKQHEQDVQLMLAAQDTEEAPQKEPEPSKTEAKAPETNKAPPASVKAEIKQPEPPKQVTKLEKVENRDEMAEKKIEADMRDKETRQLTKQNEKIPPTPVNTNVVKSAPEQKPMKHNIDNEKEEHAFSPREKPVNEKKGRETGERGATRDQSLEKDVEPRYDQVDCPVQLFNISTQTRGKENTDNGNKETTRDSPRLSQDNTPPNMMWDAEANYGLLGADFGMQNQFLPQGVQLPNGGFLQMPPMQMAPGQPGFPMLPNFGMPMVYGQDVFCPYILMPSGNPPQMKPAARSDCDTNSNAGGTKGGAKSKTNKRADSGMCSEYENSQPKQDDFNFCNNCHQPGGHTAGQYYKVVPTHSAVCDIL